MHAALEQAQAGAAQGEVPVGAIVVVGGEIVSRAHNEVESGKDASAHAEILAMRRAALSAGDWRLNDALLCVTLEPCTMCIGAAKLARIPTIVFGAEDPRLGAVGSLYDLSQDARNGPVPRVIRGIEEERCRNLLQEFFKRCRNRGEVT